MEKIHSQKTSIYRVSPVRLYSLPVFLGLFAAPFFGLEIFGKREEGHIGLIMGSMMALFALGGYLLVAYARLEISSEGIAVRQSGFRLDTTWDNIAELRLAHATGASLGFCASPAAHRCKRGGGEALIC